MSKYIIELDDRIKLVTSVGVTENGVVYTTSDYVHNLEELNSDYINEHYGELQDTAYKKGLHDGESKCRYCNDYQRGLEDAWEATKRIFGYEIDGGFPINKVREAFGIAENAIFCAADIIRDYTVQEVVDKIKTYEDKHSDRIEVGDEVEWDGDKYVVTYLNYNIETSEITDYDLLAYDGSVVDHVKKCAFTKTGKHYDIASILEAMRTHD